MTDISLIFLLNRSTILSQYVPSTTTIFPNVMEKKTNLEDGGVIYGLIRNRMPTV
jgi:hypothetical protein